MGFWNRSPSRSRSNSPKPRSRTGSRSASKSYASRPDYTRSTSSFFSQGGTRHSSSGANARRESQHYDQSSSNTRGINNDQYQNQQPETTSRGFFERSNSYSAGRSYNSRARPRSGFVARVRKFLRDILTYMKKNPFKVFFLVILPLITGGALAKLLALVGLRLPAGVERVLGGSANRGVSENERFYARGGARDFQSGSNLPGLADGIGDGLQGAIKIARMFM